MSERLSLPFRELEPHEIFDGRYQIVQEIGRGGMGIVYQAIDLKQASPQSLLAPLSWVYAKLQKLGRYFFRVPKYVALKLIFCNHINDEEAALRFKREVNRLAEAHHPYIVKFYDAHLKSWPCYYTMEYLEGKPLAETIKAVRKNSLWVAKTFEKIARALQHLHDKKIIHRDIKPGNIMIVGQENTPKLMDFGLARRQDTPSITDSNDLIGSTPYMSPEQIERIQGRKPDHRSDIFSLGSTLYEVLTGVSPFHTPQTLLTLWKIVREDPVPPKQRYSPIPDRLQEICLKCLEKNPDKRYSTAQELADDLKEFMDSSGCNSNR